MAGLAIPIAASAEISRRTAPRIDRRKAKKQDDHREHDAEEQVRRPGTRLVCLDSLAAELDAEDRAAGRLGGRDQPRD